MRWSPCSKNLDVFVVYHSLPDGGSEQIVRVDTAHGYTHALLWGHSTALHKSTES